MFSDDELIDIEVLFNDEKSVKNGPLKKAYIPPQIIPIFQLDIENNSSGSGDGDAAFANS